MSIERPLVLRQRRRAAADGGERQTKPDRTHEPTPSARSRRVAPPGASRRPLTTCRFAARSRRFRGRQAPSRFRKPRFEKVFRGRQGIVKDFADAGSLSLANADRPGCRLGAALMLASCAGAAGRAARRRRQAAGRRVGRRRQRRVRRVPELGLPLPRPHSELSGDRQDAALPRRRRQRPARPFEPARRPPVGGSDLQRPHRAARRAAELRPEPARRHRRLLPRQQRDALSATSSPASRSCASSPTSGLNGVLVAPQLALDAPDSSAGTILVAGRLRRLPQRGRGASSATSTPTRARRLPAHAGRHRRLQRRLSAGGLFADRRRRRGPGARRRAARRALWRARQVRELGRGAGRNAFFVSAYSTSSRDGNMAVEAELQQAGLAVQNEPAGDARARRDRLRRRRRASTTTTSSPPPGAARRCATSFRASGRGGRAACDEPPSHSRSNLAGGPPTPSVCGANGAFMPTRDNTCPLPF